MTLEEQTDMIHQINQAGLAIKRALWSNPANMELAKVLISKRMGLRIVLGSRVPKLLPPAIAMKRQGLKAADLLAA